MADAIRDVLIRLKIQLDGAKLPPLDTSAWEASVARAQQQARSAAQTMAQSAANVGSSPGVPKGGNQRDRAIEMAAKDERKWRQEAERIDAQAADRRAKATEDQRKREEAAAKERRDWMEKADKDAQRYADAEAARQQRAGDAARQSAQAGGSGSFAIDTARGSVGQSGGINTGALLQSGDAYKSAADGAFTLTRGIAFLSAANEKDLALMAKKIVTYQAYADIAKGSFDLVKGGIEGTKALAIAHSTAAGAAAIQSGATGALGVSMIAARGAALSFYTALTGPVGLAILGTTAAVGVGYVAWQKYSGATETAAAAAKRAADIEAEAVRKRIQGLHDLSAVQAHAARLEAQYATDREQRQHAATRTDFLFFDNFKRLQADQENERKRSIRPLLRANDVATGKMDFLGQGTGFDYTGKNPSADFFHNQTESAEKYAKTLKQIANTSNTMKMLANLGKDDRRIVNPGGALTENQEKRIKAIHEQDTEVLDRHLTLHQNIAQAGKRELDYSQARYTALGLEATRLDSIRQKHLDNSKAIDAQSKAIAAASLSDAQKIGQLTQWEQQRLKDISQRVGKAGNIKDAGLNDDEVKFLRGTGLSESHLGRYDIDRGNAAGAQEILKNLGSQNITAQESVMGKGPEGESRDSVLKFQEQMANTMIQETRAQIEKITRERAKADKEIVDGIGALSSQEAFIKAIERGIEQRKKDVEAIINATNEGQDAVVRVFRAFEQRQKNGLMGGRQQ